MHSPLLNDCRGPTITIRHGVVHVRLTALPSRDTSADHGRIDFSDGASSPPVVKMQTPPEVRPCRIFFKTGSCSLRGRCQMLSHAEMRSYLLGNSHAQIVMECNVRMALFRQLDHPTRDIESKPSTSKP